MGGSRECLPWQSPLCWSGRLMSKAKTPAQQKRNQYAAAVRARGASGHSLWFVAPPLDPLDPHLKLCSDVEFDCFHFLEGAADLMSLDYAPLRLAGDEPRSGNRHFAIGTTLHGYSVNIYLDPDGKEASPPGMRFVTLTSLDAANTRIKSWRAIVAVINRCRSHELRPVIFRCRHLIEEQPNLTMVALRKLVDEHPALVDGAVATMLRARELESDVDERLWGGGTKLWMRHHD